MVEQYQKELKSSFGSTTLKYFTALVLSFSVVN